MDTAASTQVGSRPIGAGPTAHNVMFVLRAGEEMWIYGISRCELGYVQRFWWSYMELIGRSREDE